MQQTGKVKLQKRDMVRLQKRDMVRLQKPDTINFHTVEEQGVLMSLLNAFQKLQTMFIGL